MTGYADTNNKNKDKQAKKQAGKDGQNSFHQFDRSHSQVSFAGTMILEFQPFHSLKDAGTAQQ